MTGDDMPRLDRICQSGGIFRVEEVRGNREHQDIDVPHLQMLVHQLAVPRVPQPHTGYLNEKATAVPSLRVDQVFLVLRHGGSHRYAAHPDLLVVASRPDSRLGDPELAERMPRALGADEQRVRPLRQLRNRPLARVVGVVVSQQDEIGAVDVAGANGQRDQQGKADLRRATSLAAVLIRRITGDSFRRRRRVRAWAKGTESVPAKTDSSRRAG